jgi:(5-formylfuran-3-yl)methyl phosphate synthase
MAKLLVSVRSAAEAEAALDGGAALIDVKEPTRGPLGRADDSVIAEVFRIVAGRTPVSAAMGELIEYDPPRSMSGLSYAKWGLAGCKSRPEWSSLFLHAKQGLPPECQAVVVAYADWEIAASPGPDAVCAFACAHRIPFLIDTWMKAGQSLLDWLSVTDIVRLCRRCQRAGVSVALAGSLDMHKMERLRPAEPDWFAVRGVACRGGRRGNGIDVERVRRLVEIADAEFMASRCAD